MKKKSSRMGKESKKSNSISREKSSVELIGREKEIYMFNDCLNAVSKGNGCFIMLNGEAGIGKSTLINFFAEEANTAGYSTYAISFRNVPVYDPYQPFMTLVGNMKESNGFSDSVSSEDYSDFNIKNNNDNSDSLQILQDKYTYVRQYILTKIIKQSQNAPLLICLEDLHLASLSTWQFLHYLIEKTAQQKIIIMASLRQDGRETTQDKVPLYAEVLERMSRTGLIKKTELSRFTRNNVRRYLSSLYARSDFSSRFVSLFNEISNGIPGKLAAYANILEKKGFIYCEGGIWYDHDDISGDDLIEAAVEQNEVQTIDQNLENLSPARLKLLKYCALFNDSFDHALLADITERPKIAVLKDLVFLSTQKYLLNLENERFQFRHTSTLLAVKKKITPQQQKDMHLKIAESLQGSKLFQSNKVYLLAHHYNKTNNKDLAFKYLFLAGNVSMQNLAFIEAKTFYQQAMALADYVKTDKKLVHLYLRSAWNDRMTGHYEKSFENIEKASQLIQENNSDIDINFVLLQKAFTYFRLRSWEKAIECFNQCLKNKKNLSVFSQATTYYGLGSINFELGKYDVSRQYFEEALSIVKNLNSKPSATLLNAKILNNLGALESVTGNYIPAVHRYSQSIPLYQKYDDNYGLAQVYNNIGLTYNEGKNWKEADKSFGRSLSYCDLIGNNPLKAMVFLNRAYAFTQLDKIKEAEEYNIKAYRLLKTLNDALGIAEYHKIQGIIERKEGHWQKAISHFNRAIEKFKKLKNTLGYAEAAYERGLLAIDMQDEKESNKWFELSVKNYKVLGLNKKVFEVTKMLNGYFSNLYNKDVEQKNVITSSI